MTDNFCQKKQNSPLEILAFRVNLGFIVESTELCHQISGVLCCVNSQCFGDDEKRPSKLSNGQLLSGTLKDILAALQPTL